MLVHFRWQATAVALVLGQPAVSNRRFTWLPGQRRWTCRGAIC